MEHEVFVIIGTWSSVTVKCEAPFKLDSTQFGSHINQSSTLQLINGFSNNLQKLLKYFTGTANYVPFLSVIKLDLYLNDEELFEICWACTVKSIVPSISSLFKLP